LLKQSGDFVGEPLFDGIGRSRRVVGNCGRHRITPTRPDLQRKMKDGAAIDE
jgi:hypothetical protein